MTENFTISKKAETSYKITELRTVIYCPCSLMIIQWSLLADTSVLLGNRQASVSPESQAKAFLSHRQQHLDMEWGLSVWQKATLGTVLVSSDISGCRGGKVLLVPSLAKLSSSACLHPGHLHLRWLCTPSQPVVHPRTVQCAGPA
jgi:hypothetical protein